MYEICDSSGWFESWMLPSFVLDCDHLRVIVCNSAARELPAIADSGASFASYFEPEDSKRITAFLQSLGTAAEIQILTGCKLRSASSVFELTAQLVKGGITVSLRDMTREYELEEQLRQAEKVRSVGMLASGIAHDFNNLLTIISGYAQLLQVSPDLNTERDRSAVEQVLKASQRAADLTGQLLSFSRKRPLQPVVLNVARVVEQTMSMLRRLIGAHIDLRILQDPLAGSIRADVAHIQQIVINLVVNARDAMPDGGILIIETSNVKLGADAGALGLNPGPYVAISITDTGPGMDPETRLRAFEPFFTTKTEGQGTGLGLSTVASIAAQYQGAVELVTQAGQGAAFRVLFPRIDEVADEEEPSPAAETLPGNETILLAEDDATLRSMIKAALERHGYHVLAAGSAREALQAAELCAVPVDLLLTDLVMPGGNGTELAEQLRAGQPSVKVLFISGYEGADCSSAPYLQKPFSPPELAAKVREVLDARRAESQNATG